MEIELRLRTRFKILELPTVIQSIHRAKRKKSRVLRCPGPVTRPWSSMAGDHVDALPCERSCPRCLGSNAPCRDTGARGIARNLMVWFRGPWSCIAAVLARCVYSSPCLRLSGCVVPTPDPHEGMQSIASASRTRRAVVILSVVFLLTHRS